MILKNSKADRLSALFKRLRRRKGRIASPSSFELTIPCLYHIFLNSFNIKL